MLFSFVIFFLFRCGDMKMDDEKNGQFNCTKPEQIQSMKLTTNEMDKVDWWFCMLSYDHLSTMQAISLENL